MSVENVTWETLKSVLAAVPIDYSHVETSSFYYIYTSGRITIVTAIPKDGGADVTEYEATYKANARNFFYEESNLSTNLTGNGTTTVKSGAGIFVGIVIGNNTTGGDVIVYDNTAGSGTVILNLQVGSPSGGLLSTSGLPGPIPIIGMDRRFTTGLTVVRSGSSNNNVTIFYR